MTNCKEAFFFPFLATNLHDVLPSVASTSDCSKEEKRLVASLLHLGLLCCNPNSEDRPGMRLVSQACENMESSMPALPICNPYARYSRPGFSQMAIIRSSDSSTYSVQCSCRRSHQGVGRVQVWRVDSIGDMRHKAT